jgi:hypothetical protein
MQNATAQPAQNTSRASDDRIRTYGILTPAFAASKALLRSLLIVNSIVGLLAQATVFCADWRDNHCRRSRNYRSNAAPIVWARAQN